MRKATFRIIRFPLPARDRFVGIAWNYPEAVLIATGDYPSHTDARAELAKMAQDMSIELRWFDGNYVESFGQLVPDPFTYEAHP